MPPARPGPTGDGQTILIVEGNPAHRHVLSALVEGAGYRALASDGTGSALELLTAHSPDLVITDLTLSGEAGVDLCREIRRRDRDIPIVVRIAPDDAPAIETVLPLGLVWYVRSDVSDDHLLRTIHTGVTHVHAIEVD